MGSILDFIVTYPRVILTLAGVGAMAFGAIMRRPLPFLGGAVSLILGVIAW